MLGVSDYNDAVYWAEAHYLRAFNKNDEGLHLWTYELLPSTASYVSGIATNECGDGELYATGFISSPGACEGDFLGITLDAVSGDLTWASTTTSCHSFGAEILIDSNNTKLFWAHILVKVCNRLLFLRVLQAGYQTAQMVILLVITMTRYLTVVVTKPSTWAKTLVYVPMGLFLFWTLQINCLLRMRKLHGFRWKYHSNRQYSTGYSTVWLRDIYGGNYF